MGSELIRSGIYKTVVGTAWAKATVKGKFYSKNKTINMNEIA